MYGFWIKKPVIMFEERHESVRQTKYFFLFAYELTIEASPKNPYNYGTY